MAFSFCIGGNTDTRLDHPDAPRVAATECSKSSSQCSVQPEGPYRCEGRKNRKEAAQQEGEA
jgi:hypothetical protein